MLNIESDEKRLDFGAAVDDPVTLHEVSEPDKPSPGQKSKNSN